MMSMGLSPLICLSAGWARALDGCISSLQRTNVMRGLGFGVDAIEIIVPSFGGTFYEQSTAEFSFNFYAVRSSL